MENSFTVENCVKAEKYLLSKGMLKEKINDLSGYEIVLTAEYVKQKEKENANRNTL